MLFWTTLIGGIILTLGYLPQIHTLLKTQDTKGIDINFWRLIVLAVGITAANLIITSADTLLIVVQLANTILAFYTLFLVLDFRHNGKFESRAHTFIVPVFILLLFLPIAISQAVATICIFLAYVLQLKTLIKSKDVTGVNPYLFVLIALGLGTIALKMFITDVSVHIIFTELVNIALLLLCAGVTFYKKMGLRRE